MAFVSAAWAALDTELARWRDAGQRADFWWRDDDATRPSEPLGRLLALSAKAQVPLALAVIPLAAAQELFADLRCAVLMHGTDHRNRAATAEKKTEFALAEPDAAALERLRKARERLASLAGAAFVPVLAPPWNRFKRQLAPRLPEIGLCGLTAYGPRARREAAAGVLEVNTHIDLIDWRGTRGFIGEEAALAAAVNHLAARRAGTADRAEPTGWLTHHALHDSAAEDFLARLFDRTRRLGARWRDAGSLFPSPT
jgi:hypothetical protein